jgi:mono/diheme cytochrome c family protein
MKIRPMGSCLVAALAVGFLGYAQQKQATVLDGVYTAQQAQRGAETYENICAACHEGAEPEAEPPKGSEFVEHWREAPLSFLYGFVHTNMPGNKPGTLSEETYLDVVSYLLRENGYPAGSSELTAVKTSDIQFVGKDGPKPFPANALVLTVGCLVPGSDGDWSLTTAVAPTRVKEGDHATPEEIAKSATTALGQSSYRLINAEDYMGASMKGQKVQAKGVLTKVANPFTLSVQSLERVGTGCDK